MANKAKMRFLESKALDSRIQSANTQGSEIWLGYFAGPMLLYMAYYSIAGKEVSGRWCKCISPTGIEQEIQFRK